MVQVNGIARLLMQRLSSDFEGNVKYSTSCPSRIDSPSAASRAMPTSRGFSETGSKGREAIILRLLFAHDIPRTKPCQVRISKKAKQKRKLVLTPDQHHHQCGSPPNTGTLLVIACSLAISSAACLPRL